MSHNSVKLYTATTILQSHFILKKYDQYLTRFVFY